MAMMTVSPHRPSLAFWGLPVCALLLPRPPKSDLKDSHRTRRSCEILRVCLPVLRPTVEPSSVRSALLTLTVSTWSDQASLFSKLTLQSELSLMMQKVRLLPLEFSLLASLESYKRYRESIVGRDLDSLDAFITYHLQHCKLFVSFPFQALLSVAQNREIREQPRVISA